MFSSCICWTWMRKTNPLSWNHWNSWPSWACSRGQRRRGEGGRNEGRVFLVVEVVSDTQNEVWRGIPEFPWHCKQQVNEKIKVKITSDPLKNVFRNLAFKWQKKLNKICLLKLSHDFIFTQTHYLNYLEWNNLSFTCQWLTSYWPNNDGWLMDIFLLLVLLLDLGLMLTTNSTLRVLDSVECIILYPVL